MPIPTPALLSALKTGFRTEFQNAFDATESQFAKIATTVPSSTASNTYGWMGQWPGFREWLGERVFRDMAAQGYVITNKDWESSVKVLRNDIEDDNLGVYKPLFAEAGRAAKVQPDELVFGLLKVGHSTACYDGQFFFDTDHPVYPNVDGSGSALTVSNVQAGSGPAWYLFDTARGLKPLIYQNRKAMTFTAMDGLSDENVFLRKEFRYGIDGRSNAGFGFWQMAFKSNADLSADNFNAAYAAMCSLKADGGRVLGVRPTLLVVPPNLRTQALEITKADRRANGQDNVNAGIVETLVSPWVL